MKKTKICTRIAQPNGPLPKRGTRLGIIDLGPIYMDVDAHING